MARGKKKETLTPEERLQAALVPASEQPYPVPGNWCWVRLKASINLYNGDRGTNYPSKKDYQFSGVPFINAGAIVDGELNEAEFNYISEEKYDALRAGKIQQGDILYCLRGSLGKTAIVHQKFKGAISSSLCILRANQSLLKEYLYYLLCSNVIGHQQVLAENGSAQPNLSAASVMDYMIPLSPLAEQHRIVDRIESLFAKLDEAKQKAQDALDSFETRKAAILHKAFTGELTAQWRKEHGVGMKSWENLRLENLIEGGPQNGLYKPQTAYGTGTKILRIDCFYEGAVLPWENLKRLALSKNEIEQYHLNINDIVINRVNSMAYLGKSALIRELPEECVFESNMMRITLNTRMVIPEYAIKYLNSVIGVQELRKNAKQAVNQASINQQDVKNVAIKLPKLDEQAEIVRILDDLLAKEQQAKDAAEGVLEQIDLIKKAILARAFRGELGTNDPSEESAVELVKRVLAVEPPPKARAKAVSIPREVEEQLKCELERKIMKLYYYSDSQSLPINTLMEVGSKKFEVLESIRNLEQRGIIKKLPNGNYKLVR